MNPDVITLAQVLAIVGVFSVVMIGAIAGALTYLKRRVRGPQRLDDNRLQHLEQAVDAIAIEVERISEAQRFATKLLAERQTADLRDSPGAARPARSEPH